MTHYIAKESRLDMVFTEKQSFFAMPVVLDPKVAAKLLEFETNQPIIKRYLAAVDEKARKNEDVLKVEVPLCLQDVAPSASPRKKKATAPRSSSKSQAKRKAIQSKSTTSQPKAE